MYCVFSMLNMFCFKNCTKVLVLCKTNVVYLLFNIKNAQNEKILYIK